MLGRFAALAWLLASTATASSVTGVRILGFEPETRTLVPGQSAVSALIVEHDGAEPRRVWVGYSVQSPAGDWYDVPPLPVELAARSRSDVVRLEWRVPPEVPAGAYRIVMAIWSARPGDADAERLASVDRRNSFRVESVPRVFGPGNAWHPGDHRLGRVRVLAPLASAVDDGFRLRLSPNGCDGAEARTNDWYVHGRFEARMRTPRAPGSISAFFLYADNPAGSDEVDIEILNDGTRRAILSVWLEGAAGHSAEVKLPFDPADGVHRYAIEWRAAEVALYADDSRLARWTTRLPAAPMRAMVNVWWPTWLTCAPGPGLELVVDGVRIDAEPHRP